MYHLHECVVSVHHDAQVLSQEVVDVRVPQIGKGLVRYVIEGKVAGMVVQLAPFIIHSPFVQQFSNKPFLIASHYL